MANIGEKMKDFKKTMDSLATLINHKQVYTPYVYFKCNDLIIDSRTMDPNQSIVVSMQHKKNGTGKANTFTLTIVYAPNLVPINDGWDINYVDRTMLSGNDVECEYEYGYTGTTEEALKTKRYSGRVLDYSCEIRDAMMYYTITGVSSLYEGKEMKVSFMPSGYVGEDGVFMAQPTKAIRELIEGTYLNEKYKVTFEGDTEGSDHHIPMEKMTDMNIFACLDELVNLAVHSSQDAGTSVADKITYSYYVSDTKEPDNKNGKYNIVVSYTDPSKSEENDGPEIIFNWMAPGKDDEYNHMVIDFKTEMKGSMIIALNRAQREYKERYKRGYAFDDEGEVKEVPTIEATPFANERRSRSDASIERTEWARKCQYPYKATLTAVGIPCEIPILGSIKVVPIIYGQEHLSAGTYKVIGCTDIIDLNGYNTIIELFRKAPKETESIINTVEDQEVGIDTSMSENNNNTAGGIVADEITSDPNTGRDVSEENPSESGGTVISGPIEIKDPSIEGGGTVISGSIEIEDP